MTLRFWIRVNARLAADMEVQAFAAAILPRDPAWKATAMTCGLLITLWGNVADERENGDLCGVPDRAIEQWAGWQGKGGLFAREYRARFVDDAGIIREWATYQGKLIERRAKDRKRKGGGKTQESAPTSAGIPQEAPQEFRDVSSGNPLPNDHEHDHGHTEPVLDQPRDPLTSLAVWCNSAITEKWGEQPTPLRRDRCGELADAVAHVDAPVIKESIYAQCRGKSDGPPKHPNYFKPGILSAWKDELTRRTVASSGEVAPAVRFTTRVAARPTKQEAGIAKMQAAIERRKREGVSNGE